MGGSPFVMFIDKKVGFSSPTYRIGGWNHQRKSDENLVAQSRQFD